MMAWAIALIFFAVPPLSDAQRDTLASATDDGARLEEPAMQALLTNVLQWDEADEAGAQVPDYTALLTHPAAGRGELYLIEGRFAGRARRYKFTQEHPGLGDALTEWVLVVREDPEEVAVVYFVDPEGALEAPATGAGVRVVGRFYKVWADRDRDDQPARYLTFVARSPKVLSSHAAATGPPVLPMLLLIAVLAVAYLFIRRMGKPDRYDRHVPPARRRHPDDVILSDPAEALERLAEHQDQDRPAGRGIE